MTTPHRDKVIVSNQVPDDLANVTTNLTSLANAKARVRIDATSGDADTLGSVLAIYRKQAGLNEQGLADWLGLDLPSIADLAEELRPGVGGQEMGLDQLAELYGADRARLLEVFEHAGQMGADEGR